MNTGKRLLISALVGGLGCLCGYALPHLGGLIHTQSHAQVDATPAKATPVKATPKVGAQQGGLAPDFSLEDTHGTSHKLSELHGKPVLINFWASWCGYCRQEMPDLKQVGIQYTDKLQMVGVNISNQDSYDDVLSFVKKYAVPYPNLLDRSGYVSELYHVRVLPTTLLLDKDGVIVARVQGPQTLDGLRKLAHQVGL
jgi:cytochrome c biogenesis protein CcmG, thiol:disulfide interchange protein DsbE